MGSSVHSLTQALLAPFLFTDSEEGAPTLVVLRGSHLDVAALLGRASDKRPGTVVGQAASAALDVPTRCRFHTGMAGASDGYGSNRRGFGWPAQRAERRPGDAPGERFAERDRAVGMIGTLQHNPVDPRVGHYSA